MRAGGLLALALLAALALGGCGGGGDEETTAAPGAPAGPASMTQGQGRGEEAGEGQGAKTPQQTPPQPNPPIAQERTPGSKAVAPGVPTTKGADNSIQAFGAEGEEGQAAQAAQTLGDYLNARVRGDWAAACQAASAELERQLETMVERAKVKEEGAQKPQGCAETLELFFGSSPKAALEEALPIERVLSFRVREDGYAYLIYESEGAVEFVAMANDEGAWKVNTLGPTPFAQAEEQGSDR